MPYTAAIIANIYLNIDYGLIRIHDYVYVTLSEMDMYTYKIKYTKEATQSLKKMMTVININ